LKSGAVDCVFCGIVAGREPASIVHRDSQSCAFMDIRPVNPGHVLVIPTSHAASLAELDPESGADLFRLGQRIAAAIRRSDLGCEGVNLVLADGEAAGQEVFHVHLHVIPRHRGDGSGFRFGTGGLLPPGRSALDEIAQELRGSLERGRC
jgi:diadenosine tetraphosphate (Ap4A) HIT family hydrolase